MRSILLAAFLPWCALGASSDVILVLSRSGDGCAWELAGPGDWKRKPFATSPGECPEKVAFDFPRERAFFLVAEGLYRLDWKRKPRMEKVAPTPETEDGRPVLFLSGPGGSPRVGTVHAFPADGERRFEGKTYRAIEGPGETALAIVLEPKGTTWRRVAVTPVLSAPHLDEFAGVPAAQEPASVRTWRSLQLATDCKDGCDLGTIEPSVAAKVVGAESAEDVSAAYASLAKDAGILFSLREVDGVPYATGPMFHCRGDCRKAEPLRDGAGPAGNPFDWRSASSQLYLAVREGHALVGPLVVPGTVALYDASGPKAVWTVPDAVAAWVPLRNAWRRR